MTDAEYQAKREEILGEVWGMRGSIFKHRRPRNE